MNIYIGSIVLISLVIEIIHAVDEYRGGFRDTADGANFTGLTFFKKLELLSKAQIALKVHKVHIVLLIGVIALNYFFPMVVPYLLLVYWAYQFIHHGHDFLVWLTNVSIHSVGPAPGVATGLLYAVPLAIMSASLIYPPA